MEPGLARRNRSRAPLGRTKRAMAGRIRPGSRSSADLGRKVGQFRGARLEHRQERIGGQRGFHRLVVLVLGIAVKIRGIRAITDEPGIGGAAPPRAAEVPQGLRSPDGARHRCGDGG